MKRIAAVIFLFAIVLPTAAQEEAFIPIKTIRSDSGEIFKKWEIQLPAEKKATEINKVRTEVFEERVPAVDTAWDYNFKFLDFDWDGLMDIVYYGYTGGESEALVFFKNENGKYKKVLTTWCGVTEYSAYSARKPLSFSILNYGCCASMIDYYYEYEPITNSKGFFEYVVKRKIGMWNGTQFPEKYLQRPIAFKITNDTYTLRYSPQVNDTVYDQGPFYLNTGNVVAYYGKNATGTAIAEYTAPDGRVWWFVIMDSKLRPEKTEISEASRQYEIDCVNEKINPDPCYVIGWMSSRYLEKME